MKNILAGARIDPKLLCIAYLPSALLLAIVTLVATRHGAPLSIWLRDTAAVAKLHPLTGFVSNVGMLVWCTTMAICTFSAALLYRVGESTEAEFLLASGILTLGLLLDDFFQFHEALAWTYLGIREKYVYVLIGGTVTAYFWRYRKNILHNAWGALALSVVCLACSVLVDLILDKYLGALGEWGFLLEDGLKFLGLSGWCAYFVSRAKANVSMQMPNIREAQKS